MEATLIKKSIAIQAPKNKVWNVLLKEEFNSIWYAEFSEGTSVETDWKVGSKAVFTDSSGHGIFGHITENNPAEYLALEYDGGIVNGKEVTDTEDAIGIKGFQETYRLTEKNGQTILDITSDMGAKYFEMMSEAWDRALLQIKQLAEQK